MAAQNIKDSIDKTKEFIELWLKFNQIYKEAMGKTSITPEEEEAFLETKSIIARKFQTLADSLSIDRHTIERTYDVIGQILSLKSISMLSEHEIKKIDNDWHDSYISLNRLLGSLEARKDEAPGQRPATVKPRNPVMKFIIYSAVIITLVGIMLFLAYVLGIFE